MLLLVNVPLVTLCSNLSSLSSPPPLLSQPADEDSIFSADLPYSARRRASEDSPRDETTPAKAGNILKARLDQPKPVDAYVATLTSAQSPSASEDSAADAKSSNSPIQPSSSAPEARHDNMEAEKVHPNHPTSDADASVPPANTNPSRTFLRSSIKGAFDQRHDMVCNEDWQLILHSSLCHIFTILVLFLSLAIITLVWLGMVITDRGETPQA